MPELTLLKEFDDILQDPEAIPKIRELILRLAMSGKLVEQNLDDEPAIELIKRIISKKERLIKEKKIKKVKILLIEEKDHHFRLPNGWSWVRLENISNVMDVDHKMPLAIKEGMLFISPKDFTDNFEIDFTRVKHISKEDFDYLSKKCIPEYGDLIYSRIGTIGKVRKVPKNVKFQISYSLCLIKPISDLWQYNNYLFWLLQSPIFLEWALEKKVGIGVPDLALGEIRNFLIPIPPFNEQKRIVVRVEGLMAICDQFEEQQNSLSKNCQALNESALHKLLGSKSHKEFITNWRLIENNFDYLYSNGENVEKLEQAILQLAVMGKLVEQDPDDEPANELLEKIKAEKEKLITEGKIKKSKPLPPIQPEEVPYELPKRWEWVRLGDITNYGHCEKAEPKDIPDDAWVLDLEDIESYNSTLLRKKLAIDTRPSSAKNVFNKHDVLYMKLRPYLNKVIVADDNGYCSSEMLPLRVYGGYCEPEFLKICIQAPSFVQLVNSKTYGMKMPRLGTNDGKRALIPFAPINEQKRIVARIEELMALTKQMKEQIKGKNELSQSLLEASIAEIVI